MIIIILSLDVVLWNNQKMACFGIRDFKIIVYMHGWIPQMHVNVATVEGKTPCKDILWYNAIHARASIGTQLKVNGQIGRGRRKHLKWAVIHLYLVFLYIKSNLCFDVFSDMMITCKQGDQQTQFYFWNNYKSYIEHIRKYWRWSLNYLEKSLSSLSPQFFLY